MVDLRPIKPQPAIPVEADAVKGPRKAVFPISDGDVTFIFPADLTSEGLEELENYLEIFLKKEKRRLGEPGRE